MLSKSEGTKVISTALQFWKDFGTDSSLTREAFATAVYTYLVTANMSPDSLLSQLQARRETNTISLYEEEAVC